MRFKRKFVALSMTVVLFATGCQKAPEDAVVKNKNLDKMIEQAKETGDGEAEPDRMAEKYNTYKNSFEKEKLGVKVNADAKVEIPKAEKMSVARVQQKKISQDFLDKVKTALSIDQTLYDGSVTWVRTKSDIEKEIQGIKAEIAGFSKEEEEYKEEYEEELKELQKEYENAPGTVDWSQYLSGGKIETVKSLYEIDKNNEFYSWAYSLNENGEIYYGVTDGANEDYMALYVQNNQERGNGLRFYRSKNGYGHVYYATLAGGSGNALDTNDGMWPADREPTATDVGFEMEGESKDIFYEYENEPITISEEQAKETAENFLQEIGLTDYQCSEIGLYCEVMMSEDSNKNGYRKVYFLRYLRTIDGVFVNNESGVKYSDGWQGSDFVKKEWPGESIELCINDQGIVTFNYNVPIEITENVVEKSKLKNFDEIQEIFEKMVTTVYAQNQEEIENNEVTINVDSVVLRYMRISEADSFDTGLLVPVWSFIGTTKYKYDKGGYNSIDEQTILTINAIDGSVIDTSLGY